MSIAIEELREQVDEAYVGIRLNTTKVKPVHVANGMFRTIVGETNVTKLLHRFVFHQKASGEIPQGHDLDSVINDLLEAESLESNIEQDDVAAFRRQLKRVVSADDGVFTGQMQSYSAGATTFLSRDTVGQDAGEFVASWLEYIDSPLFTLIEECLGDESDIVSQLCLPLLEEETTPFEKFADIEDLKFTQSQLAGRRKNHWSGLKAAAETLSHNLDEHPDKLFQLRMVVLFSSLVVMRHIASLESYFDKSREKMKIPFLLDFGVNGDLKDASKQSYSRCTQSIARFYAFAFGEVLKRTHSADQLARCKPPRYKENVKKKIDAQGDSVWKMKRDAAKKSKNKFLLYGEAIFDILALQAEADPTRYFRGLGRRIGLLHPPKGAAVPWFRPKQDLVELLLYCCIEQGESLELTALCKRLWDRFGILVGGGRDDESILEANSIYSWDRDSLQENTAAFSDSLVDHGFATKLADGVMKVSMEVLV
jgi:hypothetical protein